MVYNSIKFTLPWFLIMMLQLSNLMEWFKIWKTMVPFGFYGPPGKCLPINPFPQTFSTSKTLSVLVDLDQYINLIVPILILLSLSPKLIPKKFKIQNQNTNFYFSKNVQLKLSRNLLKKKFKKVSFNKLF